jgi:hypothetical protein
VDVAFYEYQEEGEMSFLADHEVLGEKFELIAVICMLGNRVLWGGIMIGIVRVGGLGVGASKGGAAVGI